jgi:asparagine synthase (glutamine-hydrolysing)
VCGICGKVDPAGVSGASIQVMMDTLKHRGPDDAGLHVDGVAGLGHQRLSIIDLGLGHQPMPNRDGSVWIVFNGEIYNYQELQESLKNKYQFATNSDTEVILHLYQEKGTECVKDLRGMFAFAIWDAREGSLFLARDHLGQKPLFYVHQGNRFAFASEIKALLADDPGLREMNGEALHQYLTLRVIAPPRSMYTWVKKLPPGHTLLFKSGQVKLERYWDLRYEPSFQGSEEEAVDELERRMLETVCYHLVSDVPVGAFLSGGLDSSLVVGMMRKVTQQPIKTFSVGVPYEDYSELPYARAVAQKYHTEHYEEDLFPSIVGVLGDLVWHLDEPSDPLSVCTYYISKMASKEVKVVLGGDGGDELFGGYDRYYGNRYLEYYSLLPRALRQHLVNQAIKLVPDGFWYKSLSQRLKWVNQLSLVEPERRYARSLGHFYFTQRFQDELYGERLKQAIKGYDPEEEICRYFAADNAHDLVNKMLYADSMVRLPDHSVMILDRTSMAHGLEARAPFMDHKLVEFMATVSPSLKIKGRTRRYIQARLGERYLPREVLERKKIGFSSALPYLLADEYRHIFQTFLSDSHLVREGYWRGEAIDRLMGEHLTRKVDHGNRLWLLCNAEVWYRMGIEGDSRGEIKEGLMRNQSQQGAHVHA